MFIVLYWCIRTWYGNTDITDPKRPSKSCHLLHRTVAATVQITANMNSSSVYYCNGHTQIWRLFMVMCCPVISLSCVGSTHQRIDLIHILARCYRRRLNQALSVLCLFLVFLRVCFVFRYGPFDSVRLFYVFVVLPLCCSGLVVSSSASDCLWSDLQHVDGNSEPYSLTQ